MRLLFEIIIGIVLFLLGGFGGVLLMCICRATGEAERNLHKGDEDDN